MKKIIKVLLLLILICIIASLILSRYIEEKSDISRKLGNVWSGGEISTYNYATILKNFEYYLKILEKEEYKIAYKLAPYEYERYKLYDDFVEDAKKINYSEVQILEILKRTEKMYSIIFKTKTVEKMEYLMTFNEENNAFTITPETFLEYTEFSKTIKKKKVAYELVNTTNYLEKYVATIKITNLSKKENVNISNISLIQNDVKNIKGNINSVQLEPEETKIITVEFETYIDFPNKIEISRYLEEKEKTEKYIFNIEEE